MVYLAQHSAYNEDLFANIGTRVQGLEFDKYFGPNYCKTKFQAPDPRMRFYFDICEVH